MMNPEKSTKPNMMSINVITSDAGVGILPQDIYTLQPSTKIKLMSNVLKDLMKTKTNYKARIFLYYIGGHCGEAVHM